MELLGVGWEQSDEAQKAGALRVMENHQGVLSKGKYIYIFLT